MIRLVNWALRVFGGAVSADFLPVRFNGTWLWLSRSSWRTCVVSYEPQVARVLREHLRPGATFYDIGAHAGLWSLYAKRLVGPEGHVVACEPSEAFGLLDANTRGRQRIECLRVALGDRVQDVDFFGQGASSSGSVIKAVTEINRAYQPDVDIAALPVRMETLDSVARSRPAPAVLKVDVEGYEYRVLEGARELMARASPVWIVEIHPPQLLQSGGSEDACLRLLEAEGYRLRVIDRNPNSLYTIVADRAA